MELAAGDIYFSCLDSAGGTHCEAKEKILANYQVQKMKTQHLYGNVVEFLRNINLIKGMGMEEFSGNSFREGLNELKEVNIKTFMVNNLTSVLSSMINNLWTFGILWYGGKLTLRGNNFRYADGITDYYKYAVSADFIHYRKHFVVPGNRSQHDAVS